MNGNREENAPNKEPEKLFLYLKRNLPKLRRDQLHDLIDPLFQNYKNSTLTIEKGTAFYRGVLSTKKPVKISDLSYTPPNKSKPGRANHNKDSIFYCSTSRHAPCFELNLEPRDRITICKWIFETNTDVNIIGDLISDMFKKKHKKQGQQNTKLSKIKKIISDFFCQPIYESQKDLYNITASIADNLFNNPNDSKHFEVIAYPACINETIDDNLAIKPTFIDKKGLKFIEVDYLELIEKKDDVFRFKLLDCGVPGHFNKINWCNINEFGELLNPIIIHLDKEAYVLDN